MQLHDFLWEFCEERLKQPVVNFANILNQNLKSDEHVNIDYEAVGNFVVFLNLCHIRLSNMISLIGSI